MFYIVDLGSKIAGPTLLNTMPLLPAILFAFIFSHNTICIQVAHVSKQTYNPWNKILLLNVFVITLYIGLVSLNV
jgi:hypothetical protein